MEQFKIIPPSALLAPYVKHYWTLVSDDVAQSQRIIPTGNIALIFHRGYRMKQNDLLIPVTSLSGQSFGFADLAPTGVVDMIVVVFHSFGAKAFFPMPLYELSDRIVAADDLNIRALKELEDQVLNTVDDESCIRLIELFLISRLNPFQEYNYKRMVTAIGTINQCSNDGLSVARLAETVCLSRKQFQRVFSEHVGASPKDYIRIVRFHKALFTLQNNPTMNFTALAYECGYYDQPHMINEFKLLSGYTPSQYVAICTPYSDYFSQ